MNATVNQFRQWATQRKPAVLTGAILIVGLVAFGGWKLWTSEATPGDSRRALWKYLRKEARTKDFKPDLDLSTASLKIAGAPVSILVTNKSGQTKTVTRGTKAVSGKAAENLIPETSFTQHFFTEQMQAETYQEMYRLIGQQLFVADDLLSRPDEQQRIIGLAMACEAGNYARTNALNLWLAARVCEAYLWPNLSLIENTNRALLTPDALLNICDDAFQQAGETNNIVRNYEIMIAKVSRSPAYVDLLRYRLAHIYQDLGQEEKALPLLKQIKNYRMNRVPQEIAAMEQRLKSR